MLVLSRRREESVVVGGSNGVEHMIKVTVLEIGSEHVKLGFQANQDVPIHRTEVWERINAEKVLSKPGGAPDGRPDQPDARLMTA